MPRDELFEATRDACSLDEDGCIPRVFWPIGIVRRSCSTDKDAVVFVKDNERCPAANEAEFTDGEGEAETHLPSHLFTAYPCL